MKIQHMSLWYCIELVEKHFALFTQEIVGHNSFQYTHTVCQVQHGHTGLNSVKALLANNKFLILQTNNFKKPILLHKANISIW